MPSGIYVRKPFTKEHKTNLGKAHKGKKRPPYSEEWKRKLGDATLRMYKNKPELRKQKSEDWKGKNNPGWKDGNYPEIKRIRHSLDYRLWREEVFENDNYSCQKCGDDRGGNLNAHHIQNFIQYSELRFVSTNGITFCEDCHNLFHKIYGVKNNNKGQVDEFILLK